MMTTEDKPKITNKITPLMMGLFQILLFLSRKKNSNLKLTILHLPKGLFQHAPPVKVFYEFLRQHLCQVKDFVSMLF